MDPRYGRWIFPFAPLINAVALIGQTITHARILWLVIALAWTVIALWALILLADWRGSRAAYVLAERELRRPNNFSGAPSDRFVRIQSGVYLLFAIVLLIGSLLVYWRS